MNQEFLNAVRIDDWDYQNIYEEKFGLPLTGKHKLTVGVWNLDGRYGVDLRRFSYNEDRLIGWGVTLSNSTFQAVFKVILELNDNGMFLNVGEGADYERVIHIDPVYELQTKLYDNSRDQFFCINLAKNKKPMIYGAIQRAIMIRFNKIGEFIEKCYETGIICPGEATPQIKQVGVDTRTGRELF